jgi:anti-sigma regulatory factor (Ser/Thr protein kinase)
VCPGVVIAQLSVASKAAIAARLAPDADAVSRAVGLARAFAGRAALDDGDAGRLAVVVEEWIANVVEHGKPQDDTRIVLRLTLTEALIRIACSDGGAPFDPRTRSFEGPNLERGGGAGLALILDVCRIAAYVRRAGRNRLVLELPVQAGPR